eukprot:2931530-Rhodomonas_salina.3
MRSGRGEEAREEREEEEERIVRTFRALTPSSWYSRLISSCFYPHERTPAAATSSMRASCVVSKNGDCASMNRCRTERLRRQQVAARWTLSQHPSAGTAAPGRFLFSLVFNPSSLPSGTRPCKPAPSVVSVYPEWVAHWQIVQQYCQQCGTLQVSHHGYHVSSQKQPGKNWKSEILRTKSFSRKGALI